MFFPRPALPSRPAARWGRRCALLGLPLLLAATAWGADLSFVRVWTRWQDTDSVERISEFFTGRENMGERVILHSRADSRDGLYFIVRVQNRGPLVTGTKFVISVILPLGPDPRVFTFPADVPAGGKVYQIGLTGIDWPGRNIAPVAWKFELVGPDGHPLVAQESFLWSKPE